MINAQILLRIGDEEFDLNDWDNIDVLALKPEFHLRLVMTMLDNAKENTGRAANRSVQSRYATKSKEDNAL